MATSTVSSTTGQGWVTIGTTTTTSGTSATLFSGIAGYKKLMLTWVGYNSSTSTSNEYLRFNGDTGANYAARLGAAANTGNTTIPLNASNSGARSGYLIIDNVIEAAPKIAIGNTPNYDINAAWFDTSALTSISLTSGTAFTAGTWTLYGIAA
jgi:hypothetical protein